MQAFLRIIARAVAVIGFAGVAGALALWMLGDRSPIQVSIRQPAAADVHGHEHGPGEDEHSHDAEVNAFAITAWSEAVEIFYEYAPVVKNEPAEFVIHATVLATGQPIEQGSLTLTARPPVGEAVTITSDAPQRPGIFKVEATFAAAGNYSPTIEIASPQLAAGRDAIEAPRIEVFGSRHDAAHALLGDQAQSDQSISFLKEQQWRMRMLTEVAAAGDLAETLTTPGKVTAPHPSEAMVPPPLPGRVLPPPGGHFPHAGDKVKKGQVIAILEPSIAGAESVQLLVNQSQLHTLDAELAAKQSQAEAELASAELQRQLAETNYDRAKNLTEKGVTAGKTLQVAQRDLGQAEARLAGLDRLIATYQQTRARLEAFSDSVEVNTAADPSRGALSVALRSPISGVVVDADVTAGELVAHDHTLFRIINPERLFIEAEVSEYDLAAVEKSRHAAYRLSAYPDRIVPILGEGGGRLVFIGSVVDPDTRTVPLRYEVPNPQGRLRVGMFTEVLIETERRVQAVSVPIGAVVDDAGESIVFVQSGGETFERRGVRLGIRSGDRVEIEEGVASSERVVTQGGFAIRLSTMSGSGPQHHHH